MYNDRQYDQKIIHKSSIYVDDNYGKDLYLTSDSMIKFNKTFSKIIFNIDHK